MYGTLAIAVIMSEPCEKCFISFMQLFMSAGMAELADAPDLGSGVYDVQVQVLLPALEKRCIVIFYMAVQRFFDMVFRKFNKILRYFAV